MRDCFRLRLIQHAESAMSKDSSPDSLGGGFHHRVSQGFTFESTDAYCPCILSDPICLVRYSGTNDVDVFYLFPPSNLH